MSVNLPPVPPSLKQIQSYLKIASEHDERDVVVSYWARLYGLQVGMKASSKQPDETALLLGLMDWLEATKKEHSENEAITNEVVAQAHLENYALKLFQYADKQDRDSNFGKNVVKAFYTSSIIYDILQTFGELSEEAIHNRKYAKWKAAYIHTCLKNGETPIPGPMQEDNESPDQNTENSDNSAIGFSVPPSIDEPVTPDPTSFENPPPSAEEVLNDPTKLPNPPKEEEKNPGGFIPYIPPEQPQSNYVPPPANVELTMEQMQKAQKYCKHAGSALSFDDVPAAIEILRKTLHLLTTGEDLN
ncbi:vacuolar protein sorting-associated protein VTA1 homolog [Condylostylus longicornis]|uniref:vacuolar protein sorting-associated protein VTA1 homolog n=1 Tax=Condylostylus longicornis TaxID=2530218 RepID=UPI00244DDFA8|nr:vacuolar protein sorting-associated protein VTA1 homolog [Condylostylus longicornis]